MFAARCTSGNGETAAGLVSKTSRSENQLLFSLRRELAGMNHSFSSIVVDPRTKWTEITLVWPLGGLIAGGSGIVSTAATKRNRQISNTTNLNFKASSSKKRLSARQTLRFNDSMICHSGRYT